MAPQDPPKRYILEVGPVHVSFRPTDQTFYGQTSIREIKSREVTTLSYINDLGNPFDFPEDTGNGSGLIRIINNSTGVAVSAAVYNKDNPIDFLAIGYEDFNPPLPVQYGKVGLVPVIGTAEVPLGAGVNQLVQVLLETVNGLVVVERVVALRGQIVTIEIGESNLEDNQHAGSKVTVINNTDTPTTILGLYVYNEDNPETTALYSLNISSPPKGGNQAVYVLSTTGLPIVQGATYKARLGVYGNGNVGMIEKDFVADGQLYSLNPDTHTRTITLNQSDLPPELVGAFKPVTGITIAPSPYPVNSTTESDLDGSNKTLKAGGGGTVNLNNIVTVSPANASMKGPIKWNLAGGAFNKVSLSTDGQFDVTGIADPGNDTVTVTAVIENAAGTSAEKTNFAADIVIQLTYQNTIRTVKVDSITLISPTVETGQILDLTSLVTLKPSGANINGVPITPADITWSFVGTDNTGSNINGSTFTAGGTAGTVTIQATLPADKNDGTEVTQSTTIAIVNTPPANHRNISSVTWSNSSPQVPFYTKNTLNGATKTKIVYDSTGVYLTGNIQFNPPNATRRSPVNWAIVSGDAADKVFLRTGSSLVVKRSNTPENPGEPILSGGLPVDGDQLRVKATIPGANYNSSGIGSYEDFVSGELSVSLQEVYSNNVVDLTTDFWLDPTSLEVGHSVDLKTLAHLPSGATRYVNGNIEYITANDLTWQIVSGSGAVLSGSSTLTGTAAGQVTIQATLPANKNQGEALVRTQTITITAPVPPPPTYPGYFTLRIIKLNGSDYVSQIALVPVTNDNYDTTIRRTGHTKVQWAFGSGTLGVTKFKEFKEAYPQARYISITKLDKENDWTNVTIPWPTGNVTGYHVFFIEGDSRVRGYVNPGKLDPKQSENFLFFLRPDYLYDNYRLWMNGYKQAAADSSGSLYVIPIGYDSYYNTASIMKTAGVGTRPTHDLSDY
jgi:hypothetical protein